MAELTNHLSFEFQAPHEANDYYVSSLPTPPRPTFISPCSLTEDHPDVLIRPSTSLPFLQNIDWQSYMFARGPVTGGTADWKYEDRHFAQSVLPFLFLGPTTVCRDMHFMKQAQISLILFVRHANPLEAKPLPLTMKKVQELGIAVQTLDVTSSQELVAGFPRAASSINNHLMSSDSTSTSPSVLVCCDSGNARSAAVVTAYCMDVLGITLETALHLLHSKRFCISLDDALKFILSSYADILEARRDVAMAASRNNLGVQCVNGNAQARLPVLSVKRSRMSDEDDEAMGDVDDAERFADRSFAPFNE